MDETLGGWLDALASGNPTPGGGAAAALLIATGAALVDMVCNLTIGREKFQAIAPLMQDTHVRITAARAMADRLRIADSDAYDVVSAAYGMPRATSEEKAARSAQIQVALRGATEVPLRIVELGVEVLELAAAVVHAGNPNVISDVGAGALSARAGAEAGALNVRINLVTIKDQEYAAARRTALTSLLARADAAAGTVLSAVHAKIDPATWDTPKSIGGVFQTP
jgi:formiminotetrahydrofolate cyclodeaminase